MLRFRSLEGLPREPKAPVSQKESQPMENEAASRDQAEVPFLTGAWRTEPVQQCKAGMLCCTGALVVGQ